MNKYLNKNLNKNSNTSDWISLLISYCDHQGEGLQSTLQNQNGRKTMTLMEESETREALKFVFKTAEDFPVDKTAVVTGFNIQRYFLDFFPLFSNQFCNFIGTFNSQHSKNIKLERNSRKVREMELETPPCPCSPYPCLSCP